MSLEFQKGYKVKTFTPYGREDLEKYKFSPSQIPKYINKSGLSYTAIAQLYQELISGKKKIPFSQALTNGTEQEDVSISLYNNTFNTDYEKNEERYENDIIKGTPDIITPDKIIDIKTSYTLESYNKYNASTVKNRYMYQGLAYCILLDKSYFDIALTNIENNRLSIYKFTFTDNRKRQLIDNLERIRKIMISQYDTYNK